MTTETTKPSRWDKWRTSNRAFFAALFLFVAVGGYFDLFTEHHATWAAHTRNVVLAIFGTLWFIDEIKAIVQTREPKSPARLIIQDITVEGFRADGQEQVTVHATCHDALLAQLGLGGRP